MSEVLNLLEVERAVRQTIVTFSQAFDDEDWQAVRASVSTEVDAEFAEGSIRGADQMLTVMRDIAARRQASGTQYMHILGEMKVVVSGEAAEASAFHVAYLYRQAEVSNPRSKSGSRFFYRLGKEAGTWKIRFFAVRRLWLEGEPY